MINVPVTIVCPTHKGSKKLPKLLKSIFSNKVIPNEIIICGTSKNDFKYIKKKKNIKLLISSVASQSYQRNLAVKESKNQIIIQCDDDLILDKNFVNKMFEHFKNSKNEKKIVSASILTSNNFHQSIRWNRLFRNNLVFKSIIFFLNKLKKPKNMSIISSGRIAPLLPKKFLKKKDKSLKPLENNEWLCSTICFNKRYYSNNYSKTKVKKSFYEDVIFTHSLYKKKFNLILDPNIIAYHPIKKKSDLISFWKTIPVHFEIVRKFNKSYFMFFIDIFLFSIIYIFSK